MKFNVNRQTLLLTAGLVWLIAGANILRVGLLVGFDNPQHFLLKAVQATVVFLLFFFLIFKRLYGKHTQRIEQKTDQSCPFAFFDAKGWVVMGFMITLGFTVRNWQLLPDRFISVFYTGLSLALMLTGLLFLRYWWQRRTIN
ncbi:hypothetical protein [Bacteroides sp.]|uniref:hypothetical protein n=1 Tax=Bacteroides sp. TaxID=29523 RepID=UPI001B67AD85|nr:hypothetical protein [Bacteroides sp.]MBP6066236.1 hypothetical protein [Bacteroides sp.]MBP6066895.1 hypothetical protein [Bacteroides sp.]MBP6936644.1 hypothetical protein [Bacteroides sp.]MBP8621974.1 hypothetical protein [Bacteroides sp.]MBP9507006.1 hypothetical protein [Bacteroides sp.]